MKENYKIEIILTNIKINFNLTLFIQHNGSNKETIQRLTDTMRNFTNSQNKCHNEN